MKSLTRVQGLRRDARAVAQARDELAVVHRAAAESRLGHAGAPAEIRDAAEQCAACLPLLVRGMLDPPWDSNPAAAAILCVYPDVCQINHALAAPTGGQWPSNLRQSSNALQRARPHRQHAAWSKPRASTPGPCRLFLKLESHNPGGSIKDRIGAVDDRSRRARGQDQARRDCWSKAPPATPGSASRSSRSRRAIALILVVPDKMSQEKIFHLQAMGAEVVLTRSDVAKGHPEYYQDLAERIARETPRRLLHQPVRQSRQSARARGDHRPGDLGADGRPSSTRSCSAAAPAAR